MGQVAKVQTHSPNSYLINDKIFPFKMHHAAFLVVTAIHHNGLGREVPSEAFKEQFSFISWGVLRIKQDIQVMPKLFTEYGDHLLRQCMIQPVPIDQDQSPLW